MGILKRSDTPLESNVFMDQVTVDLISPFDYDSDGREKFYPYLVPDDLPKVFNIGLIVGASGTGKSTLLKSFGEYVDPIWGSGSIASHFDSAQDASEKFSAAGLMSVPTWVKPFHVLSNGEKFRANLARSLSENSVIDEFTSVVDRNVARAASRSMSRHIKYNDIKNVVISTVHRDIIEFLEPDWIIDTDLGEWHYGRWLHGSELDITIYPASNSIWDYFSKYHYLSGSLNNSSRSYLAVWEEKPVAFYAVLPFPSGTVKNAYRGHRLVVHPDYQGLGIGVRMSNAVAQHYIDNGKRFFAKTSHPRLGSYRDSSQLWKPTKKNHKVRGNDKDHKRWEVDRTRWTYSHEYVGLDGSAV